MLLVGAGPEVIGEHFRGLLVFDRVAFLWKVILLLFVIGVVIMWLATTAFSMRWNVIDMREPPGMWIGQTNTQGTPGGSFPARSGVKLPARTGGKLATCRRRDA